MNAFDMPPVCVLPAAPPPPLVFHVGSFYSILCNPERILPQPLIFKDSRCIGRVTVNGWAVPRPCLQFPQKLEGDVPYLLWGQRSKFFKIHGRPGMLPLIFDTVIEESGLLLGFFQISSCDIVIKSNAQFLAFCFPVIPFKIRVCYISCVAFI